VGDLTNEASYAYIWNGQSQLTTAGGTGYTYDGNGFRVKKRTSKLYWRDIAGTPLDETDTSGNVTTEFIYFNGGRIASLDGAGYVHYWFTDHLGTTRAVTQANGTLCYDADSYPFGGEVIVNNGCPPSYKFTGYERDSETGLDYAMFRYYNNRLGRFMTPDPLRASASTDQPQSLNRYPYVTNSPTISVDPTGAGLVPCPPGTSNGTFCTQHAEPEPADPTITATFLCMLFGCQNYRPGMIPLAWIDDIRGRRRPPNSAPAPAQPPAAPAQPPAAPPPAPDAPPPSSPASAPANNGDPTLDNRANELAAAINRTGVKTMANPCTYVAWTAAAGLAGAGGAAVTNYAEIEAAAVNNAPTLATTVLNWWFNLTSRRGKPGLVRAAVTTAAAAGKAANTACKQF
jgi:RHS repeat-associated protein